MVDFKVGDKVRLGIDSLWTGMEGFVTEIPDSVAVFAMTVTKEAPCAGYKVGSHVHPMKSSVSEVIEKAFPRVVDRMYDIQVGDRVRVTYSNLITKECGISETVTRVREGVVGEKRDGYLIVKNGSKIIDAFYDGRSGAVYEILSRPVDWTKEAEVGDKFMVQADEGVTVLHKRSCDWTVHFRSAAYSRSSASISSMYGSADAVKL